MITKLTLTIEDKVVHSAKKYAHRKGKSLSHLVENYFKSISAKECGAPIVSAKVSSLKGVLQLPDDFNYKTEWGKSISAKYNQ